MLSFECALRTTATGAIQPLTTVQKGPVYDPDVPIDDPPLTVSASGRNMQQTDKQMLPVVRGWPRLSIMSCNSRTSALHDLWSIVLSRVSLDNERPTQGAHARGEARGGKLLVMPPRLSPVQAHTIVKRGISSRSLTPLSKYLGLDKGAVSGYLGLDRAAASRREAKDEMLPTYAADSLLRLLELDDLATQAFETPEEAAGWMREPHPTLDGASPLECAKSGFGAQRVKDILAAIRYGGVA